MVPSKEKKSTETLPGKEQMVDLPDKDFTTTVLKIPQVLKEDMEKVKKITQEQNEISIKR